MSSIGPQLSPKDWCVLNLEIIVTKRRDAVETKERAFGRWWAEQTSLMKCCRKGLPSLIFEAVFSYVTQGGLEPQSASAFQMLRL